MIIQFQPFYSVFIQFKTRVKNVCWYSKEINSIMVPIRITIKLVSILIKGNDSRDGMAILLFLLGCIGCSTCCHPLVLINVLPFSLILQKLLSVLRRWHRYEIEMTHQQPEPSHRAQLQSAACGTGVPSSFLSVLRSPLDAAPAWGCPVGCTGFIDSAKQEVKKNEQM